MKRKIWLVIPVVLLAMVAGLAATAGAAGEPSQPADGSGQIVSGDLTTAAHTSRLVSFTYWINGEST